MVKKPAWINEFLAARKTPFKRSADAVWAAQAQATGYPDPSQAPGQRQERYGFR